MDVMDDRDFMKKKMGLNFFFFGFLPLPVCLKGQKLLYEIIVWKHPDMTTQPFFVTKTILVSRLLIPGAVVAWNKIYKL